MDDLVERIRALCRERGTSITKLEEKLGYANGTIGKWKKARKPAPLEKVMQVANELDTTTDYLITGEQKTPADTEIDGLDATKYNQLNDENKALIDAMIEKLYRSQE